MTKQRVKEMAAELARVKEDGGERQTRYRITGMDCAACGAKVETALRRLEGVRDVQVSVTNGVALVRHVGSAPWPEIKRQVTALGYGVEGQDERFGTAAQKAKGETGAGLHSGMLSRPDADSWWQSRKARLTMACGAALAGAFLLGQLLPAAERWAFLIALAVGLVPIARRAFSAMRAGIPFSIETLMTIAAVGAVIIGATEEAATVVFLFLIGELLEGVATSRARASIQGLTALVPKTALLEGAGGATEEVAADSLRVGAVIVVRPGDRIPADGAILAGESSIDEAPVTGESTPKRKGVEENVFAGTVNLDAVLRIRVTAAAADNTIARVVRLVEEAQESKAPTERFIDRFSRYYTPGVIVVAGLVATLPPLVAGAEWGEWVYRGLAVLLIGCPCALVISTPAAIAAGLSAGARRGLLLKGGAVLEGLRNLTVMALDKTGTLTEGRPKVTDVLAVGRTERDILSLAGALESGSNHPLAKAILARAKEAQAPVPPAADAAAVSGKGVTGRVAGSHIFLGSPQAAHERTPLSPELAARVTALNDEGKTVSVLLVDEAVAGLIAMRDEPRADAKAGLAALQLLGIKTIMLTGDNRRTAEAIGRTLGIEARGELLPEDKMRIVGELQRQGGRVGKVGDGINDAPALAAADIGIAMGGGTDVALETADAAVLHGRVMDIPAMVALSQRTMANIHQNITIALGLKAVFLVTTIIGVTGLWPAILADTGATVLVTANALRLLKINLGFKQVA